MPEGRNNPGISPSLIVHISGLEVQLPKGVKMVNALCFNTLSGTVEKIMNPMSDVVGRYDHAQFLEGAFSLEGNTWSATTQVEPELSCDANGKPRITC